MQAPLFVSLGCHAPIIEYLFTYIPSSSGGLLNLKLFLTNNKAQNYQVLVATTQVN